MLSTSVSTRAAVSSVSSLLVILFALAIIPETFAQNPNAAPAVVMLSLPTVKIAAERPRRAIPATATGAPTALGPAFADANEIEQRAFEKTNDARRENGLQPLVWDPELCRMARNHSEQMVRRNFFSHESPDGARMTDRARLIGIAHFRMLGENIAYNHGFQDPGSFAVAEWLTSPGHRANILNANFRQSAIGVFVAPDKTVYLTQEFITR